ncbi:MAG: hypothetical protein JO115_06485 [Pseudonocardiales bacterium]|nr:hypothetical protein [Pseudonocardiales bacterium]MBV9032322.1 hypothetical protein [Pseudonocardiales bacterium]MBV9140545.1 hypothetical protein [Pseudonocardiales bacterium]MBW0009859.1 hypothetical protein [Pseudonocardiales bacterium]
MTRVIALGSVDEAQDVAPEWGRLHADGSSSMLTSPACCLASWRAFPDLGTPLLLIAVDGAGGLLGALPLTRGPLGLAWAGSPLGDEHDMRVCRRQVAAGVVPALLPAVTEVGHSGRILREDVRPGGQLTCAAISRAGCPAPWMPLNDSDPEFAALGCIPGWSRKRRWAL